MNKISVKTTALVVDRVRVHQNIASMKAKADKADVIFRPHFKTHQSSEVGQLFKNHGVEKITVSSMHMAAQFVNDGWKDILMAMPFNPLEIEELIELNQKAKVSVLIASEALLPFFHAYPQNTFHLRIKVDCGYGRSGIGVNAYSEILSLASAIQQESNLCLEGFVAHFGNTYNASSKEEIIHIHRQGVADLQMLKAKMGKEFENLTLSIGDTPSLSILDDWIGFEEARPGNFVYYDCMQLALRTCALPQIAALVACPVVAKYPARNELIVHGGGVHLSKEYLLEDEVKHFGKVVDLKDGFSTELLEGAFVKKLSQEHGTIHLPSKMCDQFQLGDLVGIIPVHSCMSANLLKNNTFVI